jgi:predicted tellurium resistance membrane protein TerC
VFEFLDTDVLTALLQVVLIDLVLAGDNAIVIGLAATGLPEAQRGKAILIGIVAATMLRILFAGWRRKFCRLSASCSRAGFCCCGYAGKCGESCTAPPQGP